VDPSRAAPISATPETAIYDYVSKVAANVYALNNAAALAGIDIVVPKFLLMVSSVPYLVNNVANTVEPVRTPTIWRQLADTAAAGDTAIWTPAGGKKIRILAGAITVSQAATCAGAQSVGIKLNAVQLFYFQISHAALAATPAAVTYPFVLPGNGYLSTTADAICYLSLNGAFTAGSASVWMCGTEE
jgi:hypothetical protein